MVVVRHGLSGEKATGIFIPAFLFETLGGKALILIQFIIFNDRQGLDPFFVQNLLEKGIAYYHEYHQEEIVSILKQKKPQELFIFDELRRCSWCNCSTTSLHEHHYPLSKSKGGKQVIGICPNCHSEFHRLEKLRTFKIKEEYVELIQKMNWDLYNEVNS